MAARMASTTGTAGSGSVSSELLVAISGSYRPRLGGLVEPGPAGARAEQGQGESADQPGAGDEDEHALVAAPVVEARDDQRPGRVGQAAQSVGDAGAQREAVGVEQLGGVGVGQGGVAALDQV